MSSIFVDLVFLQIFWSNNLYCIIRNKLFEKKKENICPVKALRSYICLRPDISNLLFIHSDGLPLTINTFSVVLKKCLTHLELSHLRITTYGVGTEAAHIGLEEKAIKKRNR